MTLLIEIILIYTYIYIYIIIIIFFFLYIINKSLHQLRFKCVDFKLKFLITTDRDCTYIVI
jgi:hypothetical protein